MNLNFKDRSSSKGDKGDICEESNAPTWYLLSMIDIVRRARVFLTELGILTQKYSALTDNDD
jgi:hypothetical protein